MLSHHKKAPTDLKALQAIWYEKLKDTGFQDIERRNGELLNQWDSAYFQLRYDPETFSAKETYFYRARQFLNEHLFLHPVQEEIWRLHCEGLGVRQIAIHIGAHPHLGGATNKDRVAELLRPIRKEFMQKLRFGSHTGDE